MNSYYDYLEHHGIKGQKWGVRRYQNEDGTLTTDGQIRYNKNQSSFRVKMKKAAVGTGNFVKKRVQQKIDERRGKSPASGLTDAELNERLARMRKEAEYSRLQREINGTNQNQGGGKKGDKKHPLLSKALTMPIATAIGVGVGAVAKEKVASFLDHRASKKISSFLKVAKDSTSERTLGKLFEGAKRAATTAGHEIPGTMKNVQDIVSANIGKKAAAAEAALNKKVSSIAASVSKQGRQFINRRSILNYVPHIRGKVLDPDIKGVLLALSSKEKDKKYSDMKQLLVNVVPRSIPRKSLYTKIKTGYYDNPFKNL